MRYLDKFKSDEIGRSNWKNSLFFDEYVREFTSVSDGRAAYKKKSFLTTQGVYINN